MYISIYKNSLVREHARQAVFQPELAAIPLGNFIRTMKTDCGTLSHIPALVVKGTNSQTSWICACKIKAGASSSICFVTV